MKIMVIQIYEKMYDVTKTHRSSFSYDFLGISNVCVFFKTQVSYVTLLVERCALCPGIEEIFEGIFPELNTSEVSDLRAKVRTFPGERMVNGSLVGGDWNMFYFPIDWKFHHPN